MPRIEAKLTNFETGEERTIQTGYPGLLMAVTSKVPTINNHNAALCMAYIASHKEAVKLKGPDLLQQTTEFFLEWDYEEIHKDEDEAEQAPLD